MTNDDKTTNPLKREPVLIVAVIVYLLADLLTGTGTNSTVGALIPASLVAALRFVVTSPATAEVLKAKLDAAQDPTNRYR